MLGVGSLYWVGYHTEFLGVATGLLSLGGAFAWIAFLSGLLREDRKKQLQEWVDDRLASRTITATLIVLVVAFVALGGTYGSVRIDGRRDTTDRFVEVREVMTSSRMVVADGALSGRAVRTFPVFVGWRPRPYEIGLDGLPRLRVNVNPYGRSSVIAPNSFLGRNIVLMRPSTLISQTARGAEPPLRLTVEIGTDKAIVLDEYRGETVWIGCDESVAVPDALRERWRLDLAANDIAEERMLPWLSPQAVAEDRVLHAGEKIRFEIGYADQAAWVEHEVAVLKCGRADCFPQEVVINAP